MGELQRRGVACDELKERAEEVLRKHAAGARQCQAKRGRRGPGSGDPGRRCRQELAENEPCPDWT